MRLFKKHWTFNYTYCRINMLVDEKINPDAPWITKSMRKLLDSWLKKSDVGLEWGSGRSTIWLSKRTNRLLSVEHNKHYANIVKEKIKNENLIDYVDYRLIESSNNSKYEKPEYIKPIEEFDSNELDYVLIDGLYRDQCALESIDKVKPNGIIIIDNIDWYFPRIKKVYTPAGRKPEDGFASELWAQFAEIVDNWRCVWTTNGVTDTAFWVKP